MSNYCCCREIFLTVRCITCVNERQQKIDYILFISLEKIINSTFPVIKIKLRYYHKLSYKGYLTNSRSREKALTNFRILFTRIQNTCTMPIMYTWFNMKETCYEAKADGHWFVGEKNKRQQ